MTASGKQQTGNGMLSKLVIIALLAITIGLYLQIIMIDSERHAEKQPAPQASVRIVEGNDPVEPTQQTLKTLPDDQQTLIMQVFAPELLGSAEVSD